MKKVVMIVLCVVVAPPLFAASKAKVSSEQKASDILLGSQVCKDKLLTPFVSADELTVDMFVAAPNAAKNGWVYGRVNNILLGSKVLYAVLVSSKQSGQMYSKEDLRRLPAVL